MFLKKLDGSLMKFHWPLYSDIIFFVDHYSTGVSNKHCLLPYFIGIVSLRNMPMHFCNGSVLKAVKMIIFYFFLMFAQNTDCAWVNVRTALMWWF